MKKLLILMLVLGLASMAQAGLVIKVYELDGTPYTGRMLQKSENLEIRLEAVGGNTGDAFPCLYSDETKGTIGKTSPPITVNIPPAPDMSSFMGSASSQGVTGLGLNEDGILFVVAAAIAKPPYANGAYFTGIPFHCEGNGPSTLTLVDIQFSWDVLPQNGGIPMDSVIINQIPEPATMLLLGLGGLLLRRRK